MFEEIKHKREEVTEDLTDSDLEKLISIDLIETETMWLLDMPGVCVANDSEEAPLIQEQNARYREVCSRYFISYSLIPFRISDTTRRMKIHMNGHLHFVYNKDLVHK